MTSYCLIISCSKSKNKFLDEGRAIDIYTGINYKTIKKLGRENKLPKNLDILIISAKYGLINSNTIIRRYELKMTKNIALKLQSETIHKLKELFSKKQYDEIFVNLGREYMFSIKGFEQFLLNDTKIIYAKGGIGQRLSQMRIWLLKNENDFL